MYQLFSRVFGMIIFVVCIGCSTTLTPSQIPTTYVTPLNYKEHNCQQLKIELNSTNNDLKRYENQGGDFIDQSNNEGSVYEYSKLNGAVIAIKKMQRNKGC